MYCNYCQLKNLRQSHHYNIENVKQRFNPTYFHSQIFGNTQPLPSKVRCTPTFHSQAFRIDGYGNNYKAKCGKKSETVQNKSNAGVNDRKTFKNGDFTNSRGKSCYNGRVKWYDQQKNEKFSHIQTKYDYSRERKYADLASSSVFDNYVYQSHPFNELCNCANCHCVNCQCGKNKIGQPQDKNIRVQKPQGCGCQANCVNFQCAAKQAQSLSDGSPQKNTPIQVTKQSCNCTNCQCRKLFEVKTCKCSNCQCVDCNCESGCCQKVPPNQKIEEQLKPVMSLNNKGVNQQVTFGKKDVNITRKGFSQPKKKIKQKPTYTVVRQKK